MPITQVNPEALTVGLNTKLPEMISKITDTELSDTSTNPVQNLVIKKYIDDTLGTINTQLSRI